VDQSAFFRELTLTRNQDGGMTMAMWMPDEFWRTTLQSSRRMTDKGITEYIAVVHPYILIAVVDAQSGFSAPRYTDVDTLVNEATIEDSHGTTYSPLPPDSVAEDIRNLIQMMRPVLSNMMGALGQHWTLTLDPRRSLNKTLAGRTRIPVRATPRVPFQFDSSACCATTLGPGDDQCGPLIGELVLSTLCRRS